MPASNPPASQLPQANLAPRQLNIDPEGPIEEDSGMSLFAAVAQMSTAWAVSMILHMLLLVCGAFFTLAHLNEDEPIALAMSDVSHDEIETMTLDMPLDFEETEELEMEEFEEVALEEIEESLDAPEFDSEFSESEMLVESEFGELTELTELDMSSGLDDGDLSMEMGPKSKFFERNNNAATVVYIVDNSISMTGKKPRSPGYGRMETALVEMAKSINNLHKSQKFYVLFYSDTAYGLFHPHTATDYIAATPENKQKVMDWLKTVECCLKTKGNDAFAVARKLSPDLIFLLGDGAFGDRAHTNLVKKPMRGTRIEALGMNLTKEDSQGFRDIAMAHGGNYRDVGITQEGIAFLETFGPRNTNRVPGPVWGLKLGDTGKKKKKKKKKKK